MYVYMYVYLYSGGSLTTSVKSPNASPLSTELIRTARSRIPGGAAWSIALRTSERASAFM